MSDAPTPEQLLADAAWLKRLALTLASDSDDADDLVQESWIAAWQRRPDTTRSLRPWLAKVLRDVAGMQRRSERRRVVREQAAVDDREPQPPDVLLAQVRLHRLLVDLVLELGEPWRTTIIARFVEGRSAAAIARGAGIPESTVRGRLREGLARLRARLDEKSGERKAWAPAVLAFGKGLTTVTTTSKTTAIALAIIVLLLFGGGASIYVATRGGDSVAGASRSAGVAVPVSEARTSAPASRGAKPWWDVEGVLLHALAGRVVASDGTPIANARVEIYGWSAAITDAPEAFALTSAGGEFRFARPRDATTYRVVATASGHAGRAVNVDPRAPMREQDPEHITIVLDGCRASAEGSVSDSSGGPIAGATVRAGDGGNPFGPTTTTTSSGHYAICLAHGAERLHVGADGYEHVSVPIDAAGRQRVDVVLAPGGAIAGRIVDADTGVGVTNAHVFVATPAAASRAALSDADGNFEITDVAAGRLHLNVWTADHGFPEPTDVEVVAGRRSGPIVVKLPAGTTVRGLVRADGRPLAGAAIRFDVPTPFGPATSLRAVAGSDGRFVAIGVGRSAAVGVRVDGAVVDAPLTIDTRHLPGELVIDTHALAMIRGRVVRHGVAVPDAAVQLSGGLPTTAVPGKTRTTTDNDGRFELPSPPPGTYELGAQSRSLGAFATRGTAIVVPAAADAVIDLDGGASISGVVVDRVGAPLANLAVTAVRTIGDDLGKATTAIDGAFTIDQLAGGGEYKLAVTAFAGAPHPLPWIGDPPALVALRDGDARAANVRLVVDLHATTVRGTVLDDAGARVPDAIVRGSPGATEITWGTAWQLARTDGDGRFEIRLAGDGPFRLEASLGGRPRVSVDNVVAGATDVILRMARVGTVRGKLVGFAQPSVTVRALVGPSNAFAPGPYFARVDGDAFELADLTAGDYAITAVSLDGRSAAAIASVRSGETTTLTLSAADARSLRATVVMFASGAPVAGVRCVALAAIGDVLPVRFGFPHAVEAISDASGVVVFDHAPVDNAIVECDGSALASSGAARATQDTRVVVVAKPVNGERPGSVGIVFERTRIVPAIAAVRPNTAASSAGLAIGDVVLEVDAVSIVALTADGVRTLIGNRPTGTTVALVVTRGTARRTMTLVVGPPD